jgi:hypothetical protein
LISLLIVVHSVCWNYLNQTVERHFERLSSIDFLAQRWSYRSKLGVLKGSLNEKLEGE